MLPLPHTNVPPPPPNQQSSGSVFLRAYQKREHCYLAQPEHAILDMVWVDQNVHGSDIPELINGDYARVPLKRNDPVTVQEAFSRKIVDRGKSTPPSQAGHGIYIVYANASIPRHVTETEEHTIPYHHIARRDTMGDLEIGDYCDLTSDYNIGSRILKKNTMVRIQDIKRKSSMSFDRILGKSTSNDDRISEVVASVTEFKEDSRVRYLVERQLVDSELLDTPA